MGPVDDHLVGRGKARSGGEHRAGIADRDPVAEERSLLRQRGGEVDRAEHQHPRARSVAGHEDLHAFAATLPVGSVFEDLAAAHREQAPGVVGDRGVGTRRTQRSGCRVGPDDQPAADPLRIRVGDDGRDRDRTVLGDVVGYRVEFGEAGLRDRLDEHVDDAAACQADRESVAVADSVAFQPRCPGLGHLGGEFVHGAFHATT